MKTLKIIIIIFLTSGSVLADSRESPFPYVVTSNSGEFYFTMLPRTVISWNDENGLSKKTKPAHGIAYELLSDGTSKEIWRVNGWYAFSVSISNDGQYLVRVGNWASHRDPLLGNLAVAFYHKDKLLKKYTTLDLIEEKPGAKKDRDYYMSHYFWQSDDQRYPKMQYKNKFKIKTAQDKIITFNIENGEIIENTQP